MSKIFKNSDGSNIDSYERSKTRFKSSYRRKSPSMYETTVTYYPDRTKTSVKRTSRKSKDSKSTTGFRVFEGEALPGNTRVRLHRIIRDTNKAYLIDIGFHTWVPKKLVKIGVNSEKTHQLAEMPTWLYNKLTPV